jgi:hypothetical protein
VRARFSAPVQTGCEVHPASYTMVTGSLSGVKQPRRGVDHAPYLALRLKKECSYTSTQHLGLRGLLKEVFVCVCVCVCVCVALGIQHVIRMRPIVTCGISLSPIFFHIMSLTARFSKNVFDHKMFNFCLNHFPF